MARVKRAVNAHKKRRSVLTASKGYRGQRSRLYRKAKSSNYIRWATRTATAVPQGGVPQVVDLADQRGRARQRHHVQPADPGPEAGRCRRRPKELGGHRDHRSCGVQRAGRCRACGVAQGRQRSLGRSCLARVIGAHRTLGQGGRGGQIAPPCRPPAVGAVPCRGP